MEKFSVAQDTNIEEREEQMGRLTQQTAAMRASLENMKSREFWEPALKKPIQDLERALEELETELDNLNRKE